jgi:uncharacterized protein YjbJ (UPF0337 family)
MTNETLKASWNEIKTAMKQKYAKLTEQDLHFVEGKEEDLYLRLQQKLGKTKAELVKELDTVHASIIGKESKIKAGHS